MSRKSMVCARHVGVAVILVSTISCNGSRQPSQSTVSVQSPSKASELSRAKASELIRNSPVFNELKTEFLMTGVFAGVPGSRVYPALESKGLIHIERTGSWCPIALTERGKTESKNWRRTGPGNRGGDNWAIPAAKRELLEVTGVSQQPPNRAEVEFTWRWTSIGEIFELEEGEAGTHRGSVTCQLYDDGWRISPDKRAWRWTMD